MARTALRLAAAAALALLAGQALAASVTCQSRDNRREDCWLRGRGEVVLVRQISNTTCVKGRNWGETRDGIYVTDGCGGVFETRGDGYNDRPGQGGGWSGGPNQGGEGAWRDLVGTRASSGEAELMRRGFREVRSESAPGGRFLFWRTPSRGCIEVRVADGRYQTIRPVNNGDCDAGRPMPGHGGRLPPPGALSACMDAIGQGRDVSIERQGPVKPGVWELALRYPASRFLCIVSDRSQVISFSPLN